MLYKKPYQQWIDAHHVTVTFKFVQQTSMGSGKGSSSSRRFRILSSRKTKDGRIDVEKTLNSKAVRDFQAVAFANLQSKLAGKLSSCAILFLSEVDKGHSDE